MNFIIQTSFLALFLMIGLAIFGLTLFSLRKKTPFQKLNRFTILAVVLTLLGLLIMGFSLINSLLGSLLVLFLIRISYVIYVDSE